jgi:hypothetical protein
MIFECEGNYRAGSGKSKRGFELDRNGRGRIGVLCVLCFAGMNVLERERPKHIAYQLE